MKKEQFLDRVKEKYPDNFTKYNYDKVEYKGIHSNVTITCLKHGDYQQAPATHLKGFGCSYCSGKRVNTEEFIKNSKLIHGDEFIYDKVNYINNTTKVIITCKTHGDFYQKPQIHIAGFKCSSCRNNSLRLSNEEFIRKANEIHNGKYTYENVKYVRNSIKVSITCPIHGKYDQAPLHHLSGKGCSDCAGRGKYDNEKFINKAKTIHGDRFDYSEVNYVNANTKIIINCKIHGKYLQTPGHHLAGKSCPSCRESHGERFTSQVLDKFNIEYKREYKLPNQRYKYDFYLPEYNVYIEYHGIQHYKVSNFFGGKKAFKKQKKNDKIKIELIKRSSGLLIVIKYTSDTLEKVEDTLRHLFTTIHPNFLKDKIQTNQEIINSNVYLINNFKMYKR